MHLIEILLLGLSYRILFQKSGTWVENHLRITNAVGKVDRRIKIFLFNMIIFFRLAHLMIFLLKRKIPGKENISVQMALALYFIGFPYYQPIDVLDYFAMAIFIFGYILNSGGEILRNQWKKDTQNKGKLYTQGFFKCSGHINYFRDLLWVIAYSLITTNIWSATIPIF